MPVSPFLSGNALHEGFLNHLYEHRFTALALCDEERDVVALTACLFAFANLIIRYHDFSQYNIRKIVGGEKMTDILGIIKTQREVRGWSEYQLAERSGLPQSTISSWYKKDMTPSFASLEKICDAFGITLSQFFADGEESVVLTPSQRKMLDKWNCLTEAQHNSLLILMDSM